MLEVMAAYSSHGRAAIFVTLSRAIVPGSGITDEVTTTLLNWYAVSCPVKFPAFIPWRELTAKVNKGDSAKLGTAPLWEQFVMST